LQTFIGSVLSATIVKLAWSAHGLHAHRDC